MKRLSVFMHWDKDNIIDDYVVEYVKGLKKAAKDIVFVSNCNISKTEQEKIKTLTKKIIVRENIGYDFMGWRDGLRFVGYENLPKYDEVIIANDSCYAPLFPFLEMFNSMAKCDCDFWGITDNYGICYYIPSFFMVFRKKILKSKVFYNFWESIKVEENKHDIVKNYEMGLAQLLINNKYKLDVYIKSDVSILKSIFFKLKRIGILLKGRFFPKVKNERYILKNKSKSLILTFFRIRYFDTTLIMWDEIIKNRCPILKVSAVRDNLFNLSSIKNWKNFLKENTDYDTSLIETHLKRMNI